MIYIPQTQYILQSKNWNDIKYPELKLIPGYQSLKKKSKTKT